MSENLSVQSGNISSSIVYNTLKLQENDDSLMGYTIAQCLLIYKFHSPFKKLISANTNLDDKSMFK